MDALQIPLPAVTDDGCRIDVTVEVEALRPSDAPPLPMTNVAVRGKVTRVGEDYLFQGRIEGEYVHDCDRCLEPARFPMTAGVIWNFAAGLPGEAFNELAEEDGEEADFEAALDFRPIHGGQIDLRAPVWEELALALPSRFVPELDAEGVCSQCGRTRVEYASSGDNAPREQTEDSSGGFAKLADMFPDLNKPGSTGRTGGAPGSIEE